MIKLAGLTRFKRIAVVGGAGLLLLALIWWALPWCVGLPSDLLKGQEVSVSFTARDGRPLRQLLTSAGERVAIVAEFEALPKSLIDATLAAEDKRFFSHAGIDWLAVARAAWGNVRSRRVVSGASTITQQLVKNTAPREGRRTLGVKVREALQARRLEREWTKEQILAAYLNRVDYGNLLTGCASAASGYFNKPLGDLTVAESAFLAALPQAPGKLNPFRDPSRAIARQRMILALMHANGVLAKEALDVALNQAISFDRFAGGFVAPHAIELARDGARATTVRTTIEAALQQRVEMIIAEKLKGLEARHVTHAAAVVIENASGDVLALAGSRDFFAKDGGQINGAWAPHSPGSAVKPFTYQLAFEKGRTPASIVADLPVEYATATGVYRPENYDQRNYGPMTYREALGNSLNVSAVKVLEGAGGAEALLERLRALGIGTLDESAEHYGLGLTIGNAPVRLMELANAYACLARLGLLKPWRLRMSDGADSSDKSDASDGEVRVCSAAECWITADILSDNQARVLCFGARSPLRLPFRVAAKTGTSSTYRDNWCLGFTPEFTVGVWAGNFDNTPMQGVSGVTGSAPIFREIFIELQKQHGTTWYDDPPEITRARIDPRNGKRLGPQSPPARVSRDEVFVRGTEPAFASAADYDATGRAVLPREFESWSKSRDNWMGDAVICAASSKPAARPLRIVNPVPGMVIKLDPDIPNNGSHLLLRAESDGDVTWSSKTLVIREEDGARIAVLTPGRHEIVARESGGAEARTFVIVVQE